MKTCIAFVSHVLNPAIRDTFARLVREAPADHDVVFVLSSDDPAAETTQVSDDRLVRIGHDSLLRLGYPAKCDEAGWSIDGNLDLAFLEFRRRRPGYDRFWFVEYDVHWEGRWEVLFDYFRSSPADVLGATMQTLSDAPHKFDALTYPQLVVPDSLAWRREKMIKGFLPICRLSRGALDALDEAYRRGLGGHYEITVPSVSAQAGLVVEDIGGRGHYVRPENQDRFYFANGATSTHSPGTFVFRPAPKVMPYQNTLWHPVKPDRVPLMHPMRMRGNLAKNLLEVIKPQVWHLVNRVWFATRWRSLKLTAVVLCLELCAGYVW